MKLILLLVYLVRDSVVKLLLLLVYLAGDSVTHDDSICTRPKL